MKRIGFPDSVAKIQDAFGGDLFLDELQRLVYSTDASVYQQQPAAVACPRDERDIGLLVELARQSGCGLIPRAGGTSLAGQVVGPGMVVDVSRYMTGILEIDVSQRRVRVQPGVIRDELNRELAAHGLFFGPETSTSNRATIGGMLGNNSCGSNSIVYGSMRDQVLEVSGFLGTGSRVTFSELTTGQTRELLAHDGDLPPARRVLRETLAVLNDPATRQRIRDEFPGPGVSRRNTGYAVDRLLESEVFGGPQPGLNPCQLIAGSEGTLFFATEISLRCHPLPPPQSGLLCPHFESVDQALRATRVVMEYRARLAGFEHGQPGIHSCELIDHFVLEGAGRNIGLQKNLDFVAGSPAAILMVEIRGPDRRPIETLASQIRSALNREALGYASPLLFGDAVQSAWELRKAGLGVVANVTGDARPVTLIEDTAVAVEDLPDFIAEVDELLTSRYQVRCVHYGHAGAGELHLRPVLNLKSAEGVGKFRQIATDVAALVKRYRGSLSGEHGDGRLRSEFLEFMIGRENHAVLREIKKIWDPGNVFNPGKIIDPPSMTGHLRYRVEPPAADVGTVLDFSETGGLQGAAEMCSGSGDCRKTARSGGVMCPSYMATRNERDSTRARANVLRQVLTDSRSERPLGDERIRAVMDLCLSCKGCKAECPSNVDVGKMKAEFLHGYYQVHGTPRRAKRIAGYARINAWASKLPRVCNWLTSNGWTSRWLKRWLGFHPARSLPGLPPVTFRKWFAKHEVHPRAGSQGRVLLFCDEFTNYLDVPVGVATVELLERLGYSVRLADHDESGRAAISQGILHRARELAEKNTVALNRQLQDQGLVLVGIEPSALLTLRDEYPALVERSLRPAARQVAARTMLIDEFVSQLIDASKVSSDGFTREARVIRLHGHCHQKALSSMKATIRMLQLPRHYQVRMIPSGCCGMAGAFGYEREHYEVSMKVGELVLFPAVREEPARSLIAAGGTSCRHQILDGTGRTALHPVQILAAALLESTEGPGQTA